MSSRAASRIMASLTVAIYSGLGMAAADPHQLNLPEPQSEIARQIYDQHTLALWICLGIFVVVFGTMFYSVLKHRKDAGYKAANFHHSTTVEIIWTTIPFLILIGMAYPATKTVIAMKDTSSPDITIKTTGYQWKWGYDYLMGEGEGISFLSALSTPRPQLTNKEPKGENYLLEVDNPLVVPVGKKVRVLITGGDVLHAWYVPAFGVKQDAVPGFIRDAWFRVDKAGTYRGQCAELCGKEHGFMPIVVEAVSAQDFADWSAKHKTASASAGGAVVSVAAVGGDGKATYEKVCSVCHATGVTGAPKFGDKSAWAPRIATGMDTLHNSALNGKNVMPPRGGMASLPDGDVIAAVDYMVKAAK